MLETIGASSMDKLIEETIPADIRMDGVLQLPDVDSEVEAIAALKEIMSKNQTNKSHIGMGYYGCTTPPVILRNVLESPAWYTAYTPYQAEISQGRMESLLNYQTMVSDLTGFPFANASLLDESTAAAEAMALCFSVSKRRRSQFFVADDVHPQTIAVLQTRADGLGIEVVVGDKNEANFSGNDYCGSLLQYPATDGKIFDYEEFTKRAHDGKALVVVATDLLALTMLRAPGEFGADVAVGNSQRFGVPMGYGGPHAAFFSTSDKYKRSVPGRVIGVSRDSQGKSALRMAMQTREQHIRRDKATSNICTAQALLANMAAFFALYHGPEGLRNIAARVHASACVTAHGLDKLGYTVDTECKFFDTVRVDMDAATSARVMAEGLKVGINFREMDGAITIALDETTRSGDIDEIFEIFAACGSKAKTFSATELVDGITVGVVGGDCGGDVDSQVRTSSYLQHENFHKYHTETEMLRYIYKLQDKDYGLQTGMVPLGSCTMKLNATSEMMPVTWNEVGNMHPFCPVDQAEGYKELTDTLVEYLSEITGFHTVSLQPNSGASGEYAGLLAIREYHRSRGDHHRNVCIIPLSAHGTNPASAAMCGMKIVTVGFDDHGNVNAAELKEKAELHSDNLAALMVTYPSTHGVFEEGIKEMCDVIHQNGGQVYMDGANMNAQVGLTRPGDMGADVCHLNLHKTFCIPHGGGGPGVGPIGLAKQLAPFAPGHPVIPTGGEHATGAVAGAPWGSASILPITWMYIRMMGSKGLTEATQQAILNANYMAKRLEGEFEILFTGTEGRCAHEFILDVRMFKTSANVDATDIAKRLQDYSFHAPTMSWPVTNTLMIEPTESESKAEMDRMCDAFLQIREEIRDIEEGRVAPDNNVLKNSPHTAEMVLANEWDKPYERETAAYPVDGLREKKFWPTVGRLDDVYGDRNVVCTCPPVEAWVR